MNTLLIVGFGDIARRALPLLAPHFEIIALVRSAGAANGPAGPRLRIEPGDLDEPASLVRFAGRATHVLHSAPPPRAGSADTRTESLLAALASHARLPERIVYFSTSGVYGDCGGAWVDENHPIDPQTDRARRRADAERQLVEFGAAHAVHIVVLRAPGIYAAERLPLKRLHDRTPVLKPEDDVYTNHIHADDLAAMVAAALVHPEAAGIYNACDDSALTMGAWFDLVADRSGLPRPPRIARADAAAVIPQALYSFMSESRRLRNERIKRHLGIRLRYPTVHDGLPVAREALQ